MKNKMKTITVFLVLLISLSLAAIPGTINYQGALQDANGSPINDTKYIIFRIYDDEAAGTLLWSENHPSVIIMDGIFSEKLGGTTSFPTNLFDNAQLYLTFFVGGEEMSPRTKLISVPYAVQAREATNADTASYASTVGGVALTGLVQQNGDGDATITGTMTANAFVGDGSGLTNMTGAYDPIYINAAGPDAMTANSTSVLDLTNTTIAGNGLKIIESGTGVYVDSVRYIGVDIDHAGSEGIRVNSAGSDGVYIATAADDGIEIYKAGTPSTQTTSAAKNGFEVAGAEGNGLYVGQADDDGVYINSTDDDGVHINSAGDDGVYIHNAGTPTTHIASSAKNGVEVDGAEGNGIFIGRVDNDGIQVNSAGGDGISIDYVTLDGVYVYNAGAPSTQTASPLNNGFEVAGAEGNGLYVGLADSSGVHVKLARDNGLRIDSSGYDAIEIDQAGLNGVSVDYASTGGFSVNKVGFFCSQQIPSSEINGFEVAGAQGNGLYVGQADINGVYVDSASLDGFRVFDAGDDGVYVHSAIDDGVYANTTDTSHEYGINTPDKMYAGAGYSGAAMTGFAQNSGSSSLEAGDLVCISGGYEENVLGESGVPVVKIEKANSRNSEAIFGVVEYKVYIREEVEELKNGKTEINKSFRYADGDVNQGDYLSVVVFGPANVKVDSKSDIKIGEKMTISNSGDARSINDEDNWRIGTLGKALEDSNGKGMIKVYVNCK